MSLVERSLVLDCDPGCDDALALLLAISSGAYRAIDILTVAGNVGVAQTTANATRILALAVEHGVLDEERCASKVFRGAAVALDGRVPSAASVHGRDGLGDVPIEVFLDKRSVEEFCQLQTHFLGETTAFEQYRQIFRQNAQEAAARDLVCTGPLTNLAQFVATLSDSECVQFWSTSRWKRFVVMGGAVRVAGNVTYAAEFNAHADPQAFAIVLKSIARARAAVERDDDIVQMSVVPLDATEQCFLYWNPLEKSCSRLGQAIGCMLTKYFLFHQVAYPPPFNPEAAWPPAFEPQMKNRVQYWDRNWERWNEARRSGSGGASKRLKWCYLHDPLAVFLAAKERDAAGAAGWEEVSLQVETAPTAGRGHFYAPTPRGSFFELGLEKKVGNASRASSLERRELVQIRAFLEPTAFAKGLVQELWALSGHLVAAP